MLVKVKVKKVLKEEQKEYTYYRGLDLDHPKKGKRWIQEFEGEDDKIYRIGLSHKYQRKIFEGNELRFNIHPLNNERVGIKCDIKYRCWFLTKTQFEERKNHWIKLQENSIQASQKEIERLKNL